MPSNDVGLSGGYYWCKVGDVSEAVRDFLSNGSNVVARVAVLILNMMYTLATKANPSTRK